MRDIKVLLLLLLLFIAGCGNKEKKEYYIPEKPFVIVGKFVNSGNCNQCSGPERRCTRFYFVDKNGRKSDFCDYADMYNIGDTIK